nr:hypothetical protein [Cytophagales bacterium]
MITYYKRKSKPLLTYIIFYISLFLCVISYVPFDVWFFDFLIQFRIHISFTFLLIAGLFLFFREILFFFLQLLISFMFLLPVVNIYQESFNSTCLINPGIEPLRVVTFNKYRANKNYDEILALVREVDPDILFLLETNRNFFEAVNDPFNKIHLFTDINFSKSNNYRSLLYSKYPIDKINNHELPNGWQYVLEAEINHSFENISFLGIHTQSPKTKERLKARDSHIYSLSDHISKVTRQERPIIVAGDFNSVPWHPIITHFKNRTLLKYRIPENAIGTWPSWMPAKTGVMIDHIFFSKKLGAVKTEVLSASGSDHLPVSTLLYFCE